MILTSYYIVMYSLRKGKKCDGESMKTLSSVNGGVCFFYPKRRKMKGGPCDDEAPDAGGHFTNAVAHANSVLFGKMGYIDTGQLILKLYLVLSTKIFPYCVPRNVLEMSGDFLVKTCSVLQSDR